MSRPSIFSQLDKKDLLVIEKVYKKGFTDVEVADIIGVHPDTIQNWKKSEPGFFESLKDWKIEADARVEQSLYKRATGYDKDDKHYTPDTTACIFWLKNRKAKDWRDKQDINVNPGEDEKGNKMKWEVEIVKADVEKSNFEEPYKQ